MHWNSYVIGVKISYLILYLGSVSLHNLSGELSFYF